MIQSMQRSPQITVLATVLLVIATCAKGRAPRDDTDLAQGSSSPSGKMLSFDDCRGCETPSSVTKNSAHTSSGKGFTAGYFGAQLADRKLALELTSTRVIFITFVIFVSSPDVSCSLEESAHLCSRLASKIVPSQHACMHQGVLACAQAWACLPLLPPRHLSLGSHHHHPMPASLHPQLSLDR